jgi:hypothetical protein
MMTADVMSLGWCSEHAEDEWVSEWLLLNSNLAIFQLYHGENKFHLMK